MLLYEKKKNTLTVKLRGELDHSVAAGVRAELDELILDPGVRRLVFDLNGLEFMDSSGIALILRAQQRMCLLDGSVLVCHVPEQAKRVLDAAGIRRLVTIR